MILRCLPLLCVAVLQLGGCVIIHPKAETVITVGFDANHSEGTTIGFEQVYWAEHDDGIVLAGKGSHHRAHESYAFFINEGFPAYQPRYIFVHKATQFDPTNGYTLNIWLDCSLIQKRSGVEQNETRTLAHYQAPVCDPKPKIFGGMELTLKNLQLESLDGGGPIWITGRIKARHATPEVVDNLKNMPVEHVAR